jgi:hypothetical protein
MNMSNKQDSMPFKLGDLLFFHDDEQNRKVYGYVISVIKNEIMGDYDVTVRWNDTFVVTELFGSTEGKQKVQIGIWQHRRPPLGLKY